MTSPADPTQPRPTEPERVPVEIDFEPLIGQGGGIDSFRNEPPPDVKPLGS